MLILVKLFLKVNWLAALSSEQSRIIYLFILSVFVTMKFIGKYRSCYIQLSPDIK